MTQQQIQQEISIIKSMIEKTRSETAESGYLFIFMGIAAAVFVLAIRLLEVYRLNQWILPTMIVLTVINGVIGYFIVMKLGKLDKVTTYLQTISLNLWIIGSIALIMLTFVFPLLRVYSYHAVGVLVSVIVGILVYMTGVIYKTRFLQWFSIAWWIGAILLALINSQFRFLILIASIIIGWIIPGIVLNRKYKAGRAQQ